MNKPRGNAGLIYVSFASHCKEFRLATLLKIISLDALSSARGSHMRSIIRAALSGTKKEGASIEHRCAKLILDEV
jgi:hypothetical protein